MSELLVCFFDVFLFPINPDYLDFENNPVMLLLCTILMGIGIWNILMRCYHGILGLR